MKTKFEQVHDCEFYTDYEAALLTQNGLMIDVRLSIPKSGCPGTDKPYLTFMVGDENDAHAYHKNGDFIIPHDLAAKLIKQEAA